MTLKPRALQLPGQHIRIIAPASNAQPSRIAGGAAALTALGYQVTFGEHAQTRHAPYFAATVDQRLSDLHAAFLDPSVDIVMCTRGGYGSNYLLPHLDLALIRTHPKPFFAYSDLTAIHTWLIDQTGLVCFHGPMLAADFYREDGVDQPSFAAALAGGLLHFTAAHGLRTLCPGHARGTLYGGCLTLLAASLGTPYAPQTEGKLLFLEDVAAKPYQVDRMLRQLELAGKLDGVTGIIFGEMLDCVSPGADPALLDQVILQTLDWFRGPIAIGLRSGHVSRANLTLPLNIEAELLLEGEPALRTREPAVASLTF
jgi:muramoyltetrapeptide carboxypeptidase